MSPDPGRTYTVGCSFDKLIPDEAHRSALRDAVSRVHKSTILATELLNLHVRRCIEDCTGDLEVIFTSNWLLNAYNEVSRGKGTTRVDDELRRTCDKYMPPFVPVDRQGLTQTFAYECRNLAAVGSTNVWMHFQRRVQTYVKLHHTIDRETYNALTKDERRQRYLHLLQVADDICRPNAEENRSPGSYHSWIREQRKALGIDDAVGEWTDKPILYHLKEKPQRFIKSMYHMSQYIEEHGERAFALFPLRRSLVPRHIRVDQQVLRTLLHLGKSEHSKTSAKRRRMNDGCSTGDTRQRRTREDLLDEKAEAFDKVLNIRAANVRQGHLFDFAVHDRRGMCPIAVLETNTSNAGVVHDSTSRVVCNRRIEACESSRTTSCGGSRPGDTRTRCRCGSGRPKECIARTIHVAVNVSRTFVLDDTPTRFGAQGHTV